MRDGAFEDGGIWTNNSDRNLKEEFRLVKGRLLLAIDGIWFPRGERLDRSCNRRPAKLSPSPQPMTKKEVNMSRTMTRISFLAVLLGSLPLGLLGQQPRLLIPRPHKPILGPAQTQQPQNETATAGDTATYISFEIPAPVVVRYETGINPAGVITGYYFEPSLVAHGFLRASDGTVSTIDPPGSTDTIIGQSVNNLAGPPINPAGAITGRYCNAAGCHGFLRAPDGTYTTFDVPAGDTTPDAINPAGTITGWYCNAAGCHGFLRATDGTFTTFDVPGDVGGTYPGSINPRGMTTGPYIDANNLHGFLRAADGTITTFDVPGAVNGTWPSSINPAGTIAGNYYDANFTGHGFVRASNGAITTFDPPGSTGFGTFVLGNNPAGAISGSYYDANGNSHGFVRSPDGTITTFDFPGSIYTSATVINPAGVITGDYFDANGRDHGFLRCPGEGGQVGCGGNH
jgi:predicted membrane protein